jgi:hypothetical protein
MSTPRTIARFEPLTGLTGSEVIYVLAEVNGQPVDRSATLASLRQIVGPSQQDIVNAIVVAMGGDPFTLEAGVPVLTESGNLLLLEENGALTVTGPAGVGVADIEYDDGALVFTLTDQSTISVPLGLPDGPAAVQTTSPLFSYFDKPPADDVWPRFRLPFAAVLRNGAGRGAAGTAATGTATWTLYRAASLAGAGTAIATLTFTAANSEPVLATTGGADQAVAATDYVWAEWGAQDATLANVTCRADFERTD